MTPWDQKYRWPVFKRAAYWAGRLAWAWPAGERDREARYDRYLVTGDYLGPLLERGPGALRRVK